MNEKRWSPFRCDRHKAINFQLNTPLENKEAFPHGSDPRLGNASSSQTQSARTSLEMTTAMMVVTRNTPVIR